MTMAIHFTSNKNRTERYLLLLYSVQKGLWLKKRGLRQNTKAFIRPQLFIVYFSLEIL